MNIVHNMNMIQKTTSSRILRKRAARRAEIQAAALDLIVAEGLEALTMQKLAARLDYAVGALYRYYPSKDKLLASLQAQILESFTQVLQAADAFAQQQSCADPQSQALARIYLAAQVYFELREHAPTRFHLLNEMIVSAQEVLSLQEGLQVMKVVLPLFQHIAGLFEQAADTALRSGESQRRALLFWAALQGALPLAKLTRFAPQYAFKALFFELQDSLLQGWGASPEACQTAFQTLNDWSQHKDYSVLFQSLQEGATP